MPPRLDRVVISVATRLMNASASTADEVRRQLLADLAERFGADAVFLRRNDHDVRASKLVAEWPPRPNRPDPDPLGVVSFASADPVFAYCAHGKEPVVIPLEPAHETYRAYRGHLAERRQVAKPSVAVAPLVSRGLTTGLLGFVKFDGDGTWNPRLMDTLASIAPLFAGFQVRIAAEEKLLHLAEHDDLTGLHNRRWLIAHLSDRLTDGYPGPVAILYLDLDRLKSINDYFGHTVGDRYLQTFAERLQASMGDLGVTARHGGDEFVAVPDRAMPIEIAESLAQRLWTALRAPLKLGNDMVIPPVSIGVAVGMPGRITTEDLLRRADEAVMSAKRAGGNQIVVHTDEMEHNAGFRTDIELHLRKGVENGALLTEYRPEVRLAGLRDSGRRGIGRLAAPDARAAVHVQPGQHPGEPGHRPTDRRTC